MASKPRRMRLTRELVDRVIRVEIAPPLPFPKLSDAEYDEAVRALVADAPAPDNVWLFAYGP